MGRDLCAVTWNDKSKTEKNREKITIASVEDDLPENRFNDGKCDALGRLWAGKGIIFMRQKSLLGKNPPFIGLNYFVFFVLVMTITSRVFVE